jgi:predicted ATP-dependent protease
MQALALDQLYRYTSLTPEILQKDVEQNIDNQMLDFMQHFHPRAYQSLNFGLHLKRNQNHIFIMGEPGVGRIGMTKAMLRREAKNRPVPKDVVLVSEFSEVGKTQYLYFKAGSGYEFKKSVEKFIAQLKDQLPVIFDGHVYQQKNQQLENKMQIKQQMLLQPALDVAKDLSVDVAQSENSFVLSALIDGKAYRSAELSAFGEEIETHFTRAFDKVEDGINEALSHFPFLQHEFLDEGKKLNTDVANSHLEPLIQSLKMEFGQTDEIKQYLDDLQKAIVNKLHLFWDQKSDSVTSSNSVDLEELLGEQGLSIFEVNLLVDHRGLEHSPVIYEQNASMHKLFGYAINSAAARATDTTSLAMNHQAGLLQKANGGFLMINIQALLKESELWSSLKATLLSKKMTFEVPSSSAVIPYHLPDFPLDVTLVLIGQPEHFYALQDLDAQFSRLFKVQVEFESELVRTQEFEATLARQLMAEMQGREEIDICISAYEHLIEYASRLAEDKNRLYSNKALLRDILSEASAYARANGFEKIDRKVIEATLAQRDFHTGLVEDYYHRAIIDQQVLISTKGEHIGMVNGLTVLTVGRQSFGQPVRITAQSAPGDEGVVDIEREVDMAGPIHSKGMLILSGYLRGRYMRTKAMGFSGSIVMEQSYNGVEGDSASSAELIALLSSIAEVPIKQNIAITGSINQFGEIQPIGGVNEKIEGFYKICKQFGLDSNQGVIIPAANAHHLMLNNEVRAAVERGQFQVFSVKHIDEALSLMTGCSIEDLDQKIKSSLEKMNDKDEDE